MRLNSWQVVVFLAETMRGATIKVSRRSDEGNPGTP